MPNIPTPIRAALGLAASAVAEARKLPETLPQLPVAVVSTAMQASLRVQQRIATYAARGDEVLSQLRGTSAEPPAWATFDDDPAASAASLVRAAFDRAEPVDLDAADLAERSGIELDSPGDTELAGAELAGAELAGAELGGAEPAHPIDTASATSGRPPADIESGRTPGGKAAPGKTPPAKLSKAPAKKAAAKKAPAKSPGKSPGKQAPAKKAAGKKAPARKSEPLAEAARKADPAAGPNPSTMAAEILHAHSGESAAPGQQ